VQCPSSDEILLLPYRTYIFDSDQFLFFGSIKRGVVVAPPTRWRHTRFLSAVRDCEPERRYPLSSS